MTQILHMDEVLDMGHGWQGANTGPGQCWAGHAGSASMFSEVKWKDHPSLAVCSMDA